jgi:ABC-type nitrate/sulfonate/bicarbonate transport system substrate-binding protein
MRKTMASKGRLITILLLAATAVRAQQNEPLIPLQVELLSRAVSKMPLMIAYDQGLYKKHGLDVKLWLPEAEYPGGIETAKEQPKRPDISVDGGTPMMVSIATNAAYPHRVILASTDCKVRWHIIGQKGLKSVDELKGKRLGVSGMGAMTSFIALLFAQRMKWDPVKDISIMSNAWRPIDLQNGLVDAFVADERYFATAKQAGFPILADTSEWGATIAGNSVRVEKTWLQDPKHRDAAKRFLEATVEGLATFHQNREEAVRVMMKWHGMDRETANVIYTQGMALQRKPYPCYDGIKKTMELFDSNEMRKYKATDFYDDSILKEIDQSGFIDKLYH